VIDLHLSATAAADRRLVPADFMRSAAAAVGRRTIARTDRETIAGLARARAGAE
jgi:hypothetical protein